MTRRMDILFNVAAGAVLESEGDIDLISSDGDNDSDFEAVAAHVCIGTRLADMRVAQIEAASEEDNGLDIDFAALPDISFLVHTAYILSLMHAACVHACSNILHAHAPLRSLC